MSRLKPKRSRTVPTFLVLLAIVLAGCGAGETETEIVELSAEEEYWVEQYLRVVEARMLAARGDSLADGHFNYLSEDLPADSLLALTEILTERDPQRWPLIFEELVRRKKIMESRPE